MEPYTEEDLEETINLIGFDLSLSIKEFGVGRKDFKKLSNFLLNYLRSNIDDILELINEE